MNLIDTFNINKKDIITIVGAGGKTSLMYSASSLYRNDFKILVTTTTKIYVPKEHLYDDIIILDNICNDKINNKKIKRLLNKDKKGIFIVGNNISNNKIIGLSFKQLDELVPLFDLVIIEGDGSKEKPLKGWNDTEPIVYPKTTKTIGIVDITSVGLDINEKNIHRLDRFLDIINEDSPNIVKLIYIQNIILNKNGLFKNSRGDKILFINKVENNYHKKNAINLIKKIKNENTSYINNFIYGSIFKNEFIKG